MAINNSIDGRSDLLSEPLKVFYLFFVSMRPRQWIKNLFIFAGLIFSRSFLNAQAILLSVAAFFVFCIISGASYVLNDIADRERDAANPSRRGRPIASGELKPLPAMFTALPLIAVGLGISFFISREFYLIVSSYFILTALYTMLFKGIAYVDILVISSGFVLRAAGGASAIGVRLSGWLAGCTFLLALFLALNKRRSEAAAVPLSTVCLRKSLSVYKAEHLEGLINLTTVSLLLCFCLYTVLTGRLYMLATLPAAVFSIARFKGLVRKGADAGTPEGVILRDRPLLLSTAAWGTAGIILTAFFGEG